MFAVNNNNNDSDNNNDNNTTISSTESPTEKSLAWNGTDIVAFVTVILVSFFFCLFFR